MARIEIARGMVPITGSDNFSIYNDLSVQGKIKNPSGSLVLSSSVSDIVLSGNVVVEGGGIVIDGDVYVKGVTTIISSSNLAIFDPLLILAASQSVLPPSYDAGFIVERGTGENRGFIWSESQSRFETIETDETGSTAGAVAVKGYSSLKTRDLFLHSGSVTSTGPLVFSSSVGLIYLSGNIIYKEKTLSDAYLTEVVYIGVDPSVGVDSSTVLVTDQAIADAHGSFQTIVGALRSLPNGIPYRATLLLSSGTHSVGALEEFTRYTFMSANAFASYDAKIVVQSKDGLIRVPATSQMSVSLSPTTHNFNLIADPGFVANQYEDYFMKVISGSGSGQIKGIREHSGTYFNFAGRFSPAVNSTSIVEIVQPAAIIDYSNYSYIKIQGGMPYEVSSDLAATIIFSGVMFTASQLPDPYGIYIFNAPVAFDGGCMIMESPITAYNSSLRLGNVSIDVKNNPSSYFAALYLSDSVVRSVSSESSWMIKKSLGNGITLDSNAGSQGVFSTAYLFKGSIDKCVNGVELRDRRCSLKCETLLIGSGNTGYGYSLRGGARLDLSTDINADYQTLSGNLGFVYLDGIKISRDDINGDEFHTFTGISGSVVMVGT
jgi:hypothetical protein